MEVIRGFLDFSAMRVRAVPARKPYRRQLPRIPSPLTRFAASALLATATRSTFRVVPRPALCALASDWAWEYTRNRRSWCFSPFSRVMVNTQSSSFATDNHCRAQGKLIRSVCVDRALQWNFSTGTTPTVLAARQPTSGKISIIAAIVYADDRNDRNGLIAEPG